jgi:hypothetical protein
MLQTQTLVGYSARSANSGTRRLLAMDDGLQRPRGDGKRDRRGVATDAARGKAVEFTCCAFHLPAMGSLGFLLSAGLWGVQHIGPRGVHTWPKSDANYLFFIFWGVHPHPPPTTWLRHWNIPSARVSIWMLPMELLDDVCHTESCFGLFGDCVSFGAR